MDDSSAQSPTSSSGFRDLIFFVRKSFLHIVCLWAFFVLVSRSELLSLALTIIAILLIHFYRFPPASPDLTNSICLQGNSAKSDGSPVVFGHRGCGSDMPENTLTAFRTCRAAGADGIELDVEFTSDAVAVILHDDTVDRTTDGSGEINEFTFEEARNLNAAAKHSKSDLLPSEPLPTLEEALTLCLDIGLHVFIEVKSAAFKGTTNASLAAAAISDLYARFPRLYQTAMVCSFDPRVLYLLRRRNPGIVTAMIWRPWVKSYNIDGTPTGTPVYTTLCAIYDIFHGFILHGFLWYYLGFSIMSTNKNDLSANSITWWRDRGVVPVTWTVNTHAEKAFFARHGVPVMTDSMTENVEEQS